MRKIEINSKLDNRTAAISPLVLLTIWYRPGDPRLNMQRRMFTRRSGYFLYSSDGAGAVSISDIGRLTTYGEGWEVVCYEQGKAAALRAIRAAALRKCEALERLAARIRKGIER